MKWMKSLIVVAALMVPVLKDAGAAETPSSKFEKAATLKVNGWKGEAYIHFPADPAIKVNPVTLELDFHGTKVGTEETRPNIHPGRDRVKFILPDSLKAAVTTQGELVATVKFQLQTNNQPIEFRVVREITTQGFLASAEDITVNALRIDGSGSTRSDSARPPSNLNIKEYLLSEVSAAKSIEYFDDTPEKTASLLHDLFAELATEADAAAALPSVEEKQKAWLELNKKLRERMDTIYAQNVGVRTAWRPVLLRVQAKFYEGKDTKQVPLTFVAMALHEVADGFEEIMTKHQDRKDQIEAANKLLLGKSTASPASGGRNAKSSRTSCFRLLLGL